MGKKFMNTVLFLAVTVAAATLTAYVGKGSGNVLLYNFTFLGLMLIIYAVGLFAGLYRMDNLSRALKHGAGEITEVFQLPGRARKEEIGQLRGIFGDRYLDKKMDDFVDSISRTEEGIAEVEDFVNIEDVDVHIHKRLLEMAPDIFTSLGILGTFIGLVWGLKNFQPTDYEVMTRSGQSFSTFTMASIPLAASPIRVSGRSRDVIFFIKFLRIRLSSSTTRYL